MVGPKGSSRKEEGNMNVSIASPKMNNNNMIKKQKYQSQCLVNEISGGHLALSPRDHQTTCLPGD